MSFFKGIFATVILTFIFFFLSVNEEVVNINKNNSPIGNDERPGIEQEPVDHKEKATKTINIPKRSEVSHKKRQQQKKRCQVSNPFYIRYS